MQLFRETASAVAWVVNVTRAFFGVRPWTSLALVCSITVGRIAALLAFFLPLKVILLAGSDGVPRYFRFFIDPDDKLAWIIGLSIGTVVFYALSLLMERLSSVLAEAGSTEVLQGANEIAVASREREEAQGYYARFCGIAANGLLVVLGFSVIGLISPVLASILAALVFAQYMATALIIERGDPLDPGRVLRMIRTNLSAYLTIFSSVNFLIGFFVLLVPFLLDAGGNLLLAILSILLMRQALGALSGGITTTSDLWAKQLEVDPMVFRDRQRQKRERPVTRNLRQVFEKKARQEMLGEHLEDRTGLVGEVNSEWRDSTIKGVYTFRVTVRSTDGADEQIYQQQVFPRSQIHLLEHEAFLFEHLSRDALPALPWRGRLREGPFDSQLVDLGMGRVCSQQDWRTVSHSLLEVLWRVVPPKTLSAAFNTSRPRLGGRLTTDLLERLEVALDLPAQRSAYESLLLALPRIQGLLNDIPTYVDNPDLVRGNVIAFGQDDYRISTWGQWTLEPIGAFLPKGMDAAMIDGLLARVYEHRGLHAESLQSAHVLLAHECRELEREIRKTLYGKALTRLPRILRNDAVVGALQEKAG